MNDIDRIEVLCPTCHRDIKRVCHCTEAELQQWADDYDREPVKACEPWACCMSLGKDMQHWCLSMVGGCSVPYADRLRGWNQAPQADPGDVFHGVPAHLVQWELEAMHD